LPDWDKTDFEEVFVCLIEREKFNMNNFLIIEEKNVVGI
jgi:hypothetical protein